MSSAAAVTLALLAVLASAGTTYADQAEPPIVLWPDGAPGAVGDDDVDVPTVTPYRSAAPASTGTSIVILPGRGYAQLASDHEGRQVDDFFNSLDVGLAPEDPVLSSWTDRLADWLRVRGLL